jgi:hypothetical protein
MLVVVAYRLGHQFPSLLILKKVLGYHSLTSTLMSGLDLCKVGGKTSKRDTLYYIRKIKRDDDAATRQENKYDHFRSACWGPATFFL